MGKFMAVLLAGLLSLSVSAGWAQRVDIYPQPSQAAGDLQAALAQAAAQHKHLIIDFGGNWCTDCIVLDHYFHDDTNKPLLESNYILVHVNVGHLNLNEDIAARYQVPLHKGVPALAVLDEKGALLYSQKTGEFESMRHMESAAVTAFLTQWKRSKS
jgi:thioredoxin 1